MSCDWCGLDLVKCMFKAADILAAAKGANSLIFNSGLRESTSGMFTRFLRYFDMNVLEKYGDKELLVKICPDCGVILCSVCANPLIMDPDKDYLCVFCGAF